MPRGTFKAFQKKKTEKLEFVEINELGHLLNELQNVEDEGQLKKILDSRVPQKERLMIPLHDSKNMESYTKNVNSVKKIGEKNVFAIRLEVIHRKMVDFYTQMKEDEWKERRLLFPVKPQDETRPSAQSLSNIKSKKKKKSLRKQLKLYDENFCIAMSFVNALNKSLFLLANDKHKMPTKKDFELENMISLGDLNKDIYDYCEFIDIAPLVFQRIRFYDGISNEDFIRDIGYNDFKAIFSKKMKSLNEEKSTGKSGSIFFQSSNGKYFIKTIRESEVKVLRRTLPDYFAHLENQPFSLLSRYYGLHKLRFYKDKKMKKNFFLVIMNNVFHDGIKSISPESIFDLKGSTYKRRTSEEKLRLKAAGKDLNFLDIIEQGSLNINIKNDKLEEVLSIIESDSKFLAKSNIIDYRLAVYLFLFNLTNQHAGWSGQQIILNEEISLKTNLPGRLEPQASSKQNPLQLLGKGDAEQLSS